MSLKNDLLDLIDKEKRGHFYSTQTIDVALNTLPRAHQFTIYTDLEDEHIEFGKDLLSKGMLRLPFENTLIYCIQSDGHHGACLVHQPTDNPNDIGGLVFASQRKRWEIIGWCFRPPTNFPDAAVVAASIGAHAGCVAFSPLARTELSEFESAMIKEWGGYWVTVVLATCSILLSKHTTKQHVPAPSDLNKIRLAKGKRPIEDSYVIRLPAASRTSTGRDDAHRKPPRLHWRRGHIRTLPTGSMVPIAPTIVGAGDRTLHKEYIFKQ